MVAPVRLYWGISSSFSFTATPLSVRFSHLYCMFSALYPSKTDKHLIRQEKGFVSAASCTTCRNSCQKDDYQSEVILLMRAVTGKNVWFSVCRFGKFSWTTFSTCNASVVENLYWIEVAIFWTLTAFDVQVALLFIKRK